MSCKKTKRKINRNWVNFDFEAFFASFFCFANLEKILNALQFYMSGSACFSFFAANVQAKNQSKSEMNLILIDFSLIYISRFLVKFPKFFTKFHTWQYLIFHFSRRREISRARKTHRNSQVQEPWSKRLWDATHVLKVLGSNPSFVYWMDLFWHMLWKLFCV